MTRRKENPRKIVKDINGKCSTFAKLLATEAWLMIVTTGVQKPFHTAIGRTSLLNELRAHVCRLCDGDREGESVSTDTGDNYDPMTEVDQGAGGSGGGTDALAPARGRVAHRSRYYRNSAKHRIATLDMPARCPEEDPGCKEVRKVRLHIEDRKTIWLHIDDVEWAVKYLFVQHQLKGVPMIAEEDVGPAVVTPATASNPW